MWRVAFIKPANLSVCAYTLALINVEQMIEDYDSCSCGFYIKKQYFLCRFCMKVQKSLLNATTHKTIIINNHP